MFTSLKAIQNQFPNQTGTLQNKDAHPLCLSFCRYLEHKPDFFETSCAYLISTEKQLGYFPEQASLHVVFLHEDPLTPDQEDALEGSGVSYLSLQVPDLSAAIASIHSYFHQQHICSAFAGTLMDILTSNMGVQKMVDLSFGVLENPVFVFDTSYQLFAATWEEAKKDAVSGKMIEQQGFTAEDFNMLQSLGQIHERIRKSSVPVCHHNTVLGIDQLVLSLNTEKDIGHIVVNAVNRPIKPEDYDLLSLLGRAIREQMEKDDFIRSSRGFDYEVFLLDLLSGKISNLPGQQQRIRHLQQRLSGSYCCAVADLELGNVTLNKFHIRSMLEAAFPTTRTVIFGSKIVALFQITAGNGLSEQNKEKLDALCKSEYLYIGVSIRFDQITDLQGYYEQALQALQAGMKDQKGPGLYSYSQYGIRHLCTEAKASISPDVFCHPDIRKLMEIDKEQNTTYAKTLYYYLLNDRNLGLAAEAMFLHRNTLKYRMQKINTLIGNDYNDPLQRQYMILSYEMAQ